MNNLNQLKRQYGEKHVGFASYTECMSRALLTGLASFALTVSATYIGQTLLKKHLPYSQKYFLLAPVALGVTVAWTVTARKTRNCQAAWMSTEEKNTFLSDQNHQ
ncbi:uncharacterized protein LOC106464607 [Limulus polyphemus]|uniref:Uncharacterized protein LOC106464607 n=1 Tax=Limulus polyphemus TaxID=6850 RepID=A0ABM1BE93_LIMPO|nr:uncharacterized protein LOC106464607 [Limulus polyphemus]